MTYSSPVVRESSVKYSTQASVGPTELPSAMNLFFTFEALDWTGSNEDWDTTDNDTFFQAVIDAINALDFVGSVYTEKIYSTRQTATPTA